MSLRRPVNRRTVLLAQGRWQIEVTLDVAADTDTGVPLVLLPSSLRDADDFDDCAAELAACGYRVMRPKPRGMGASNGPLQDMTLHTLADDVIHVVRQLGGGQPAVLVGHAFGHFVARVADLDHPSWVRAVVVAGAAARVFPEGMAQSLALASDPSQASALRLEHLQHAFFAPGNDPSLWLLGWHPQLRQAYRQAGLVPDKSVWWPVSHAPLLDLQALQDPWRPAATRQELKDALGSQVTVCEIDNASHALLVEQPLAVARAIVGWLKALPAGA
jgi:pimeloyl-ACP methyl ester carboxylesterase